MRWKTAPSAATAAATGGITYATPTGAGAASFATTTIYGNVVVNVDNVSSNANLYVSGQSEPPQFQNTIIAGSAPGDNCVMGVNPTSLGYNQISDASCALAGTGDVPNAAIALAPLADNGGPTQSHLAVVGSSTVDAIPAANCAAAIDQRGFCRGRRDRIATPAPSRRCRRRSRRCP